MGARDVKRRQLLNFPLGLFVLFIFLDTGNFVQGQNLNYTYIPHEQAAFRTLWAAWQGTPEKSSNLAGWNPTQGRFCEYLDPNSNATTSPSWQGVQCTWTCNDTAIDPNCTVRLIYVIGLTLSNASIVGTLPPDIANITNLYTLELTGNPNLTGPLPQELQNTWMSILDVHDNGFNGTIPDLPNFWNLLQLNLGGNKFTGAYPFQQFSTMTYLHELSIGDNLLYGEIQADAYANKTELKTLDISDNFFNGTLPDLNPMHELMHLDVSGNQFTGPLPDLRGFSTLRYVDLSRNSFTGTANLVHIFNLSASASLAFVDLSHNQLTDSLPSWNSSSLGSVQELYLDNNTLTGTLDIVNMFELGLLEEENSIGNSTKLGVMSLSNNSIEHVITNDYIIANTSTVFILQGNPYCDKYDSNDDAQRCYCKQICFVSPSNANSHQIVIVAASTSVAAVVLIVFLVVAVVLIKNRRYKQYLKLQFQQKFEEFDVKPTIFSYSEIRSATRDFHEDMKLGQGAYGAVYKGVLPSGNVVAVKQLYVKGAQGHDEFLNEVVLITGMKHRNLVNLKGCCLRESQRLLVYEYVDNYDVEQILLGSRKKEMSGQLASWPMRHKICLGIARGLHYLHALAHPRIIHRDIKAGNILLDANLEPKIADFGLALLFPDEQSHIMTVHIAGTKGYLAPEYASLGQLSDKVDVYSFGVLCLEIISGRHNIDNNAPLDEVYLSKWAWQLHEEDRLMELVDPALHLSEEEVKDVQRIINVCLQCISNTVERRPCMARIVSILQGDSESEVHVLGEGKLSSRWSQPSSDFRSGLDTVSEEDSSGTSSLHGKPRRGLSSASSENFAVQLSEIRAR
uniref:Leucine-rich repeat receptor-like protein kinase n=1 Tax=Pohlia nutans TaxID=140635 RepID=A0A1P8DYX3_9BRYO|nr:leucine-rich repeat receptor-like protein kinase [Pohlia nutans]